MTTKPTPTAGAIFGEFLTRLAYLILLPLMAWALHGWLAVAAWALTGHAVLGMAIYFVGVGVILQKKSAAKTGAA